VTGLLLLLLWLLPAGGAAAADFVWVVTAAKATRWIEQDSPEIGETEVGKRLELLARKGERLRVRVTGSKFGWIDAATVTDQEPAKPEGEDGGEGDGLPGGGLPFPFPGEE